MHDPTDPPVWNLDRCFIATDDRHRLSGRTTTATGSRIGRRGPSGDGHCERETIAARLVWESLSIHDRRWWTISDRVERQYGSGFAPTTTRGRKCENR